MCHCVVCLSTTTTNKHRNKGLWEFQHQTNESVRMEVEQLSVIDRRHKIGEGSSNEKRRVQRRTEIRMWSAFDVRECLVADGSLRCHTVLVARPPKLVRKNVIDVLYESKVDGNCLVDLTLNDLMLTLGVSELGVAKAVLRTIQRLLEDQSANTTTNRAGKMKISSLDPFDGWEERFPLHSKRHFRFEVSPLQSSIGHMKVRSLNQAQKQTPPPTNAQLEKKEEISQTDEPPFTPPSDETPEVRFRIGPLERERRNREMKAAFSVLQSSMGGDFTAKFLAETFCQCFDFAKCAENLTEAFVQRSGASVASILNWKHFASIVESACADKEPHEFDKFLHYLSENFGASRLEAQRRSKVIQSLFVANQRMGNIDSKFLSVLPSAARRPSSAPARLGTEMNENQFAGVVSSILKDHSPADFDQSMLLLRNYFESKTPVSNPTAGFNIRECENVLDTTSPRRPVLLFLSSTTSPSSLVESLFQKHKGAAVCGPRACLQQRSLLCYGVESESSAQLAMEAVATSGIERGMWIFVDCPTKGDILSTFLRKLGCLVCTKTSSSLHPSFRIFVRCGVDNVDLYNIPVIIQTVAVMIR